MQEKIPVGKAVMKSIKNSTVKSRFFFYRISSARVLFITTLLLVSFYLITTFYLTSFEWFRTVLENMYGVSKANLDDFIISQKASALDNSLVILIVSTLLSILKASDPSMETLNKRIAFIFPNIDSSEALSFIKKNLQRLATISPRTRVTFQIDDWDPNFEVMKAEMIYECSISNLHNQDPLDGKDIDFSFDLTSDASEALQRKFAHHKQKEKDIIWGKVSEIRTISPKTSDKWLWHTRGHHMLIDGDGPSKKTFSLEKMTIPPNEEAQLDCIWSYWTFNNGKSFDTFGGFRFTKTLEIFFVNNTSNDFTVEALVLSRKTFNSYLQQQIEDTEWEKFASEQPEKQYFTKKICHNIPPNEYKEVGQDGGNRVRFVLQDFSNDHILLWRCKFDDPLSPDA